MNITTKFKRRTEYRLHRTAIIGDFNRKIVQQVKDEWGKFKEKGAIKIVRTKLVPVGVRDDRQY